MLCIRPEFASTNIQHLSHKDLEKVELPGSRAPRPSPMISHFGQAFPPKLSVSKPFPTSIAGKFPLKHLASRPVPVCDRVMARTCHLPLPGYDDVKLPSEHWSEAWFLA